MGNKNFQEENKELRQKLTEAEELIDAIKTGAIDALAVYGEDGPQIFTLKSADHTYRMLVEKMSEGALTLNKEGIILYCNSQFAELINQPLLQVIGTSFQQYISIKNRTEYQNILQSGWVENRRGDFIIYPIDKEPVHVQLSLNAIETPEGKVLSMVVTDLTEIKKAYNQLEKTQNELKSLNANLEKIVIERTEDVNAARQQLQLNNIELINKNDQLIKTNIDLDNFIYTASHDLKAPISNIEGLVEALQDAMAKQVDVDIDVILNMIIRSVNRFKLTIQDLTNITKVQKGMDNNMEVFDCIEVVEDVKLSIADMIKKTNAEISVDFSNSRYLKFSKKNFNSIIYNLISNGIKYRSADRAPEIIVKGFTSEGNFIVTVSDNGLGISEKNKENVFTMFKRFHDHVEGTGIGLYIVKRIIENAGGTIEIESEIDKGTTFKISLPDNHVQL